MTADGGAVLFEAVVVAGDGAAAEVAVLAHVAVPHIGEVGHLGPPAQVAVFQLDKGPDFGALPHHAVGPDVGVGADLAVRPEHALLTLGGVDGASVLHGGVGNHGLGADAAVFPDHRLPPEDGAGEEQGARPHGDPLLHIDGGGVHHNHARLQQLFPLGLKRGRIIVHSVPPISA